MSTFPIQFVGVTAVAKANIYFDGKVVSHSIIFPDGSRKTIGLIYAGKFHFNTEKPERMEIVSGECVVKVDGQTETKRYQGGTFFEVPGKAGFEIEVSKGICEYICTFIG